MTIYRRTPEPPTDPPEPKIVGWCAGCLGEIYEGEPDPVWWSDSNKPERPYHEECFRDQYIKSIEDLPTDEMMKLAEARRKLIGTANIL